MITNGLKSILRMGFFWKKQTPKTCQFQQLAKQIAASPMLGHIIDNIKKLNQSKQKLLPPQLPQHKGKLTVVMELDEVLAYTFTPDEEGYMFAPLRLHDYYAQFEEYNAYLSIYKRKNLQNFLSYVSEQCQPVLWSTGVPSYVELMLKYIDPQKKIPYVFNQTQCNLVQHKQQQIDIFLKDLNLLGRDLSRVVYIDCKPLNYWADPDNCIPIQQFRADLTMQNEDINLMILQLQNLKAQKDVRNVLKQRYGIRQILKEARML